MRILDFEDMIFLFYSTGRRGKRMWKESLSLTFHFFIKFQNNSQQDIAISIYFFNFFLPWIKKGRT